MKIKDEIIKSRNNPLVKFASSLQDKKGREAAKSFLLEGEKLTFEGLENNLPITHIFVSENKKDRILPEIKSRISNFASSEIEVIFASDEVIAKISSEKAPQGVISIVKYLDFFSKLDIIYKEDFFLKSGERCIILDSLQDPGNLGSVIRSSVAFGVQHIVLTEDTADVYNTKTIRSAMGSLFRVKVTKVTNLENFVRYARENSRRVFSAELREGAISLNDITLNENDIIIIGNEGHGIRSSVSVLCDNSIYIPISENTESLNASCAAGIFMWEQSRGMRNI